ncbi:uncharacterized protein SPSC_06109 [Sporisorium scitamineum]|nr:uncharacterized protein SPSC_06109 [Sporisorium scitamineum]
MITAPRYPTSAGTEPQEPMLVVARTIITVIPHRRTPSTFSSTSTASSASTSSSSATSFSFASAEKASLLTTSVVKKASSAILNYGSMLKRSRAEGRRVQLKQSISRPVSHDSQWFECGEEKEGEGGGQAEEMERSVGSVYSTRTWGGEMKRELSRVGDAFEYDDVRSSVRTFASSERSYTFF